MKRMSEEREGDRHLSRVFAARAYHAGLARKRIASANRRARIVFTKISGGNDDIR